MKNIFGIALIAAVSASAHAGSTGLIQTLTDSNSQASNVVDDSTHNNAEYEANYMNGGGTGFGGVFGPSTISMDADATNIYFGSNAVASNLGSNVIVLYLDTRAGGFTDATMNDTSDGGRNAVTNLAANADDLFPVGFEADYAVMFGNGYALSFELTSGSLIYQGNNNGSSEVTISRSMLGMGSGNVGFNWFGALISDSGFNSNETMPYQSFNGGGNPGFDTGSNYANYNRFEAVPEPASMTALAVGALALIRRRRAG